MSDHFATAKPLGRYFEDFEVGAQFDSRSRTVTATDIANFACLSGDFNDVHSNFEYCKTTPFGRPIAHAPLVLGIAGGLSYAAGIHDGTLMAFLGIDQWRATLPVFDGDTIRETLIVLEKRPSKKLDRGVVVFKREIFNQRREAVQEMTTTLLYRRRPDPAQRLHCGSNAL